MHIAHAAETNRSHSELGQDDDQYDEDERRFTEFMQKEYERIRQEACERVIMTDVDLRDMKFKLSNSLRDTNHTTGGKLPPEVSLLFNTQQDFSAEHLRTNSAQNETFTAFQSKSLKNSLLNEQYKSAGQRGYRLAQSSFDEKSE